MKTIILILAITAIASPSETDDSKSDRIHQEKMIIDLNETSLEFFPNGTVKMSSIDDLLRLYYLKKDVDDYAGNKTKGHFEDDEDSRSKRDIIDDDERLPIPNSNLNSGHTPYCALAEVSNGCTAIFIGPNHALTAGECVYNRASGQYYSGLRLYRGRNCYQRGTTMSEKSLFTVNGYTQFGSQEYNYGLIVTSQRSPCWVSFSYENPWTDWGFDLLGYPTDKRPGCRYHPAYFSSCSYSEVARENLLRHRCDTSGMIGAPLMSEDPDGFGERSVFGVNTFSGSLYNYGTRITRDRFYQIYDWMQQTDYNPRFVGIPVDQLERTSKG